MAPWLDRSFTAPAGVAITLSPLVRRVLAPNPGPFTFRGTGVYLVGAGPQVAVIDPGPLIPAHLEALKAAIGARRVSHILVTHTHRDHSEAAAALKAWSGAPTFGFGPQLHPSTGEEADDTGFLPDRRLGDSEVIAGDGFTLAVLHTPGHAANHLCFALAGERALFTGDHVMGWSTSVIAPPDGDMAAYMAGLERLLARDDTILYPTHGAPVENPKAHLAALLEHRRAREAQLLPAAALTATAHLLKLEAEGRARRDDARWQLSGSPRA